MRQNLHPQSAVSQSLTLDTLVVTTPRISDYYNATTDTATRTQASTMAVPFSVGVVNQALLQDSMVLRLEDAAMFVSGVQQSSADSGFNTDLRIRGFTAAGSAYLDGVQDNRHFQVRDMALVEKVEMADSTPKCNPVISLNLMVVTPERDKMHFI